MQTKTGCRLLPATLREEESFAYIPTTIEYEYYELEDGKIQLPVSCQETYGDYTYYTKTENFKIDGALDTEEGGELLTPVPRDKCASQGGIYDSHEKNDSGGADVKCLLDEYLYA